MSSTVFSRLTANDDCVVDGRHPTQLIRRSTVLLLQTISVCSSLYASDMQSEPVQKLCRLQLKIVTAATDLSGPNSTSSGSAAHAHGQALSSESSPVSETQSVSSTVFDNGDAASPPFSLSATCVPPSDPAPTEGAARATIKGTTADRGAASLPAASSLASPIEVVSGPCSDWILAAVTREQHVTWANLAFLRSLATERNICLALSTDRWVRLLLKLVSDMDDPKLSLVKKVRSYSLSIHPLSAAIENFKINFIHFIQVYSYVS